MIGFQKTLIEGCVIVDPTPVVDARGSFVRLACTDEFGANGIPDFRPVQINLSTNHRAGTVRGLHLQEGGLGEGKLVRCLRGAIVDCALDMRRGSATFGDHVLIKLTGLRSLWIPPFVAHGYQALTPDTEVMYVTTDRYAPDRERGYRFDDPVFGIDWPLPVTQISEKDGSWPLVSEAFFDSNS